jgi:hypothetical protein
MGSGFMAFWSAAIFDETTKLRRGGKPLAVGDERSEEPTESINKKTRYERVAAKPASPAV